MNFGINCASLVLVTTPLVHKEIRPDKNTYNFCGSFYVLIDDNHVYCIYRVILYQFSG